MAVPQRESSVRGILGRLVCLLLLISISGAAYIAMFKPQPWFPRLRNLLFPPELAGAVLPDDLRFDKLVVEKSERWLVAYAGGRPVKIYFVALSKIPKGHKQYEGDRRVPEGVYRIDDKNPRSKYHKNLGVSYPNEADKALAEALGKEPGGDIKVHGLGPGEKRRGKFHWLKDWSHGCIVVTDEEMDEIFAHTPVGIPIEIRP